ncbi:N-6 DNA methylase [Candidatus Woesearchaeota archaeon]|nr:N-6 DNA methylase [Candidatus Woesearchaeota archaeon]
MGIEEVKIALKNLLDVYRKYEDNKSFISNEKQVCQSLIFPLIHDVLHWDIRDPSVFKVEESQGGKRIDSVVCHQGISQFIVEAKAPSKDILGNYEYYQQALGYGRGKERDFAILTNFRHLVILCCSIQFRVVQETEIARIDLLNLNEENLKLLLCFEHEFWISQGRNNPLYGKIANRKRNIPVDEELLEDMKRWREILLTNLKKKGKLDFIEEEESMRTEEEVQKFIDRLIFICFCEDKELEEPKLKSLIYDKRDRFSLKPGYLLEKIKESVKNYRKVYDSDLFDQSDCDDFAIDDDKLLEILVDLKEPKGKPPYDFKSIEADILGKTYENFIGHIQTGKKRFKEKEDLGKRKKSGIYYTPKYIVDYIVNNTVREYVKGKSFEEIKKVKVLDPACGSGSFLRVAFDVLVEESEKALKRKFAYEEKRDLMLDCIFGVDLDRRAVAIAKLNLSVKMAERGKKLPMLNENIRHGNSLIDNKEVARWTAFVWEEEFKEIMGKGGFDVVVGNPPWGADLNEKEKDYLIKRYATVPSKTKDTYFYFIIKALEILREGGDFSFIIPNTWLLINNTEDFRKNILNYNLKEIIDFGDAVFGEATVESSIIILKKETSKNRACKVKRFKRGVKLFEHLIPIDVWLNQPYCKIIIDLDSKTNAFMERLKKNSKLFFEYADIIWGIKPYQIGYGTPPQTKEVLEKRIYHSTERKGKEWKPLLVGKDVDKYQLKFPNNQYIKYGEWLMYPSNEKFMLEPKIIIRQTSDKIRACYDDNSYYCQNSLFIVHSDKINLKFLLALLNSQLFEYLYYLSNPQKGKVFAEIKPSAIKNLPLKIGTEKEQQPLINLVERMLSLNKRLNELKDKSTYEKSKIETEIKKTDKEIDELVYKIYGITEEEKEIIKESLK